MLYMLFQFGKEPVLIQRILSFEATLEKFFVDFALNSKSAEYSNKNKDDNIHKSESLKR